MMPDNSLSQYIRDNIDAVAALSVSAKNAKTAEDFYNMVHDNRNAVIKLAKYLRDIEKNSARPRKLKERAEHKTAIKAKKEAERKAKAANL
jgi:hypothetical protein